MWLSLPTAARSPLPAKQGLFFWDPLTGQREGSLPCQRPPRFLAYSPVGAALATFGEDQLIRHWNLATGQERLVLQGPVRVRAGRPFRLMASCWPCSTSRHRKTLSASGI